jgi:hypothetical protein
LAEKKIPVEGRERLLGIIEICKAVEEGKHDPFTLEIDELLEVIQRYFQGWESMEDRCLDAQTINRLATVVKLQGGWLKERSTSLYADPFLIEQKILKLQKDDLANAFLRSWHPVAELEQISPESLKAAIEYWRNLLPLADRWRGLQEGYKFELGTASYGDLIREDMASDLTFDDFMKSLWGELKERSRTEGKLDYWEFIRAESFSETIRRAYLTSFLITYGYADLAVDAINQEMFLSPKEEPKLNLEEKGTVSIPIPITYEKWMEGRRENEV